MRNVFENFKNNKVGFWSETPKNEKINKCGKKGIKTDKGTAFFFYVCIYVKPNKLNMALCNTSNRQIETCILTILKSFS